MAECPVCGRNLMSKNGLYLAGFQIEVRDLSGEAEEAWKEIYPDINSNIKVGICFPCLLRAFGAPIKYRR